MRKIIKWLNEQSKRKDQQKRQDPSMQLYNELVPIRNAENKCSLQGKCRSL